MCKFEELAVNEDGYVIRCKGCQHYQLLFGGFLLSYSEVEFSELSYRIRRLDSGPVSSPDVKSIVVPTLRQGVHFLLSQKELAGLQQMLETADDEARSLELLGLFADNQS